MLTPRQRQILNTACEVVAAATAAGRVRQLTIDELYMAVAIARNMLVEHGKPEHNIAHLEMSAAALQRLELTMQQAAQAMQPVKGDA